MFIRVTTTPNSPRKSVKICENYRKGGKVKQKIVHHVGIALDDAEEEKLKAYAQELIVKITLQREEQSKQLSLFPLTEDDLQQCSPSRKRGRPSHKRIEDILPPSQVSLADIDEEARIIEGVHEIGGAMFDEIYGDLLPEKRAKKILKDVVLARLVAPSSKHKVQQKLSLDFGVHHSLDSIYRMMDTVFNKINTIKQRAFLKTQALFPEKVDMILFDVTTLYFESTDTDELRKFGYSKDHRFNTTQVVLALATNQDGLPVGYELFEGNRAEVTTLLSAIESWRQLFRIDKVCFVGDRAMFTSKNLAILRQHNCQYIIAAKLRKLPAEVQADVLSNENYRPTVLGNMLGWVKEVELGCDRLIVSYKTSRAQKDRRDRDVILKKIEKNIGKSGEASKLITNAGVKKYLSKNEQATVCIDDEKIMRDEAWDGLHGIITNIPEDSAESLIEKYSRLWVIEESFRINKHTLEMRPIFHWKPNRIHAHIAICYMAFSVLRHLQYRINLTQKISINTILEELVHVQASIHIHKKTKDRYRVPGALSINARKIYKAFGIERSQDATVYIR